MEKWFKWTLLEAFTKVLVRGTQKYIGAASSGLAAISLVIWVSGFVQFLVGWIMISKKGNSIPSPTGREIVGSVLFGLGAVIANYFAFLAFLKGGEVIVVTFIGTLSIIPGAFADRFMFGKKIGIQGINGIIIGIIAGWFVLDCPSLRTAAQFPLWVWLSFGLASALAFNQIVTQSIKDIHPYLKNYLGGLAVSFICLPVFGLSLEFEKIHSGVGFTPFLFGGAVIGLITFFMWAFNIFAYQDGAYISLKKLVMNASYMAMIFVIGIVFFHEEVTTTKLIGFSLYIVAIIFMDGKLLQTIRKIFQEGLASAR